MFITLTLALENQSCDISVDNKQVINSAIEIMRSCGRYSGRSADFYRSEMNGRTVSGYLSFKEAGIYDGDILRAYPTLNAERK